MENREEDTYYIMTADDFINYLRSCIDQMKIPYVLTNGKFGKFYNISTQDDKELGNYIKLVAAPTDPGVFDHALAEMIVLNQSNGFTLSKCKGVSTEDFATMKSALRNSQVLEIQIAEDEDDDDNIGIIIPE